MSETRKPSSPHWNAFPEAAGLELTVPQGARASEVFGLNAELVFGQQPLSGEGVSFRLGVRTGLLRVVLESCAIVPGTRVAMHDQPAAAVLGKGKIEETEIDTRKVEVSGGARTALRGGLSGQGEIGGEASAGRTKERKASYTQESTKVIHNVIARGTNTEPSWEIGGPKNENKNENPVLDGRYLGPENLCEVMPEAEGYQISGHFVCRKRDLHLSDLECTHWLRRISLTKKKLALAVVASKLSKETPETPRQLDEGMLTLCRSALASGGKPDERDD